MNPYVTVCGPYPLTWGEYLTAVLKARYKTFLAALKGVFYR